MHTLRFSSLAQAADAVQRLRAGQVAVEGSWSPARVLHHLAASIECSVRGFPRAKPWLVRVVARRIVLPRFLRAGVMKHDREQPVPGLDEPDPDPALAPATERLLAAIAEFRAAPELAAHAVFGEMSRDLYDRYHAMHIADHLSLFTVDGRPLQS